MALHGKEVLIIDDDSNLRLLLQKILKAAGMRVHLAASVARGIEIAQAHGPHLVLIDLQMPGEDGFSLLERRHEIPAFGKTPILVLSALRNRQAVDRATALGAADFIFKPVQAAFLLEKVKKALKDSEFLVAALGGTGATSRPKATLQAKARIGKVHETGLLVESAIKIAEGTSLRLRGKFLEDVGYGSGTFKTIQVPSIFAGSSVYISSVAATALTAERSQKIRKSLQRWKGSERSKYSMTEKSSAVARPVALVLDDDVVFQSYIRVILKKLGVDSECFEAPEPFLKRLKESKPAFCLVDLNLNRLGIGFKVVQAVRNVLGPALPMFIVSSQQDPQTVAHALEVGANNFLVKPVDPKVLAHKLMPYISSPELEESATSYKAIPDGQGAVLLELDLELTEVDELGVKIASPHLLAKGSILNLAGPEVGRITGRENGVFCTVNRTWVSADGRSCGAYLEFDGEDLELLKSVRRWLSEHLHGLATRASGKKGTDVPVSPANSSDPRDS